MPHETNPVYRKVIFPWYDSKAACLVTLSFLYAFFIFGFTGLSVALEFDRFRSYIWVPGALVALSAVTILSIVFRLVKRYFSQR
jgi:hypothetical protein